MPITTTTEGPINWENEVDGNGSGGGSNRSLSDEVADAVKFYLYKRVRVQPEDYQQLVRHGKSIRADVEPQFSSRAVPSDDFEREFDPNLETKILIHGE